MKTYWHKKAISKLYNIIRYISQEHPTTAKKWLAIVQAETESLSSHPNLFNGKKGSVKGTREMLIPDAPLWVVFSYKKSKQFGDVVLVLAVFRNGKDKPAYYPENNDDDEKSWTII